jgi:hypothetical protein
MTNRLELGSRPRAMMAAALAAWLAGCTPPPPPSGEARADAARQAACRQHADQIYTEQNRAAIYLDEGAQQSYSPFSGSYIEGNTARGLPGAFRQQELVSDCIRNSDDAAAAPQPAPPAASPPPAPARR